MINQVQASGAAQAPQSWLEWPNLAIKAMVWHGLEHALAVNGQSLLKALKWLQKRRPEIFEIHSESRQCNLLDWPGSFYCGSKVDLVHVHLEVKHLFHRRNEAHLSCTEKQQSFIIIHTSECFIDGQTESTRMITLW